VIAYFVDSPTKTEGRWSGVVFAKLSREYYEGGKNMRILFLCVANSARSQMAEGLARKLFGDKAVIESAGSKPLAVHPLAIQVMSEIGIDISDHRSKSIEEIDLKQIDWVITLCAEEVCPTILSKAKRLHWPLPDPAVPHKSREEQLTLFRSERDEILNQLNALKTHLFLKSDPKWSLI
jgi:arsenate reductase